MWQAAGGVMCSRCCVCHVHSMYVRNCVISGQPLPCCRPWDNQVCRPNMHQRQAVCLHSFRVPDLLHVCVNVSSVHCCMSSLLLTAAACSKQQEADWVQQLRLVVGVGWWHYNLAQQHSDGFRALAMQHRAKSPHFRALLWVLYLATRPEQGRLWYPLHVLYTWAHLIPRQHNINWYGCRCINVLRLWSMLCHWNASDYVCAGMFVLYFLCSAAVAASALRMHHQTLIATTASVLRQAPIVRCSLPWPWPWPGQWQSVWCALPGRCRLLGTSLPILHSLAFLEVYCRMERCECRVQLS
jgi:hypothetical protein